jgi:NAD(P)-dependent dehydrogenase (short-subunit alcohol dehydrogenase family)
MQFVRQLIAKGNRVVAGVRNPDGAQELLELKASQAKQLDILTLDVSDVSSIAVWSKQVAHRYECIDVRCHLAAAACSCSVCSLDAATVNEPHMGHLSLVLHRHR